MFLFQYENKLSNMTIQHNAAMETLRAQHSIDKNTMANTIMNLTEKLKNWRDLEKENLTLSTKIANLEAQLTSSADAAKGAYAESYMAIIDLRVSEMTKTYENYAKNMVEIVKASHASGDAQNNITTAVTAK